MSSETRPSSNSSSDNNDNNEENGKLNVDLEILCWRVSRFVEKLKGQLHFEWIVLGHEESVSIRRKGVHTFVEEEDEDEEEEKKVSVEEAVAEADVPSKKRKIEEAARNSVETDVSKTTMSTPITMTIKTTSTPPFTASTPGASTSRLTTSADVTSTASLGDAFLREKTRPNAFVRKTNSPLKTTMTTTTTPSKIRCNPISKPAAPHHLNSLGASADPAPTGPATPDAKGAGPPLPNPGPPEAPRRKPYQCKFCPFSTERSLNLQNHQLTHSDLMTPKTTGICATETGVASPGVGGMGGSGGGGGPGGPVPRGPLVCDQNNGQWKDCDNPTSSGENNEIKAVPTTKTLHACTECSFTTSSLSQLNRHMLLHSDVRPYKCDKCDFACNTSLNLDLHLQTHSSGESSKPSELEQILDLIAPPSSKHAFSASDFDLSYLTGANAASSGAAANATTFAAAAVAAAAAAVSSQQQPSDDNPLPFRCGRCSYSSANLNDLKDHFGSHVGEAPLKCTKCSFSCSESTQLKEHFRNVHAKKQNHDAS